MNEQPFPEIPHLSCTHRGLFIIWLMPSLERMQLNLPEERPDVPLRMLVVDDSELFGKQLELALKGMLNWIFAVRQKMVGLSWTWCGS